MQSHGTFLKASMKGLPILLLFYFIANVLLKYMTKCFVFFFFTNYPVLLNSVKYCVISCTLNNGRTAYKTNL